MFKIILYLLFFISSPVFAKGYDVFGFGFYDVKFDGSETNPATDFRYERRFDKSLIEIGPESYDFFNLKPFAGFEITSDSATYFLVGVYVEDNIGTLFTNKSSNFIITPSFGAGYYDDGDGKKLGNNIEFRTTFEVSYQLENQKEMMMKYPLTVTRILSFLYHLFQSNIPSFCYHRS